MKTLLRAFFLIAFLPALAYAQPSSGGTTVIRDSSNSSRRAAVTAGGALTVDGSAATQPVSGTVAATQSTSPWVASAAQSGTWTVQPGNTANTTPWLVTESPAASGGLTNFHLVSAATTNLTNIKASAGQLYCWYIYNGNAAMRKVALHNTAGTPTAGASVAISFPIPAGSAANACINGGLPFNTGIGLSTVIEAADNGTTAVGLNDLVINLWYK